MFIIWGFGHKTMKDFGSVPPCSCGRCHNYVHRRMVKVTTWFTLFFLPLIPYKREYLLVCPICNSVAFLTKEEFDGATDGVSYGGQSYPGEHQAAQTDKYAGKTETQIAYLTQMEQARKEREAREKPEKSEG